MATFLRGWVIVSGSVPTAFRAREREDLLPTLKQLQRTQPDTALMWFERGRFWRSPEDAERARRERERQRTGPEWRPGGSHRDPRARPKVPRERRRELFKKRLVAEKSGASKIGPAKSGSGRGPSVGPRPGPRPRRKPGDKRRRGGDDS